MIQLFEHFGYKKDEFLDNIDANHLKILDEKSYFKTFKKRGEDVLCYSLEFDKNNGFRCEAGYFVGIDWLVESKLSVYIKPKLNSESIQINYLKMLFESMEEADNLEHLEGLCEIYFDKSLILIKQQEDLLSPFLIAQFFTIVKSIVKKGLKKSYYTSVKEFNSKVKGKILVNRTIKHCFFKSKPMNIIGQYDEFGIDSDENKILKKALNFSYQFLQSKRGHDMNVLQELFNFIRPAFDTISDDISVLKIKTFKSNALYKEYDTALRLALLILKRFGYTISNINNNAEISTPPFWIDMSKLFELYVYSKLKICFSKENEVVYHKKFDYLEPDFIIKSHDGTVKMVVDAKYKPRYAEKRVSTEDIRQVSGYARLSSVYEFFGLNCNDKSLPIEVVDCLIVYSDQSAMDTLIKHDIKKHPVTGYVNFYKIGVKLPEK